MTPAPDDPLDFFNNARQEGEGPSSDLVRQLLSEIIRVKELTKYYESIPDGAGQLGASILNELVAEAYSSLVNYDLALMQKYYDLLLNCDWTPQPRKGGVLALSYLMSNSEKFDIEH